MKHRAAILFPILALVVTSPAQEPPGAGFLNVVNLVTLREPTKLRLGAFAFNDGEAVRTGETSGLLAVVPGEHHLLVENKGAKPEQTSLALRVEAGKTVAVICYDEAEEKADGKKEVHLKFSVLVEGDSTGPRLTLVSLLKIPFAGVRVGAREVTLAPRQSHAEEVAVGDKVPVVFEGRTLAELSVTKPVHTIAFLFENPESGEVELSVVQNEKLEYHPPLDEEAAEQKP